MFYENKEDYFFAVEEFNSLQYPLHVHSYIELVHVMKTRWKCKLAGKNMLSRRVPVYDFSQCSPQLSYAFCKRKHTVKYY